MISKNLQLLDSHIDRLCADTGRQRDSVKLIAVSKTRTAEEVEQAIIAGQHCFGENTVQDALKKIPVLKHDDLEWHFIGHLQSKKSKQVTEHFQWLHTLDSIKLARKLSSVIMQANISPLNCLLQLNLSEEASKSGINKSALPGILDELLELDLPGINLKGLMTIGVQNDDYQTEKVFAELRELRDYYQQHYSLPQFDQLSMGMSNDYAIAIRQGASMIRVGTDIFGKRV